MRVVHFVLLLIALGFANTAFCAPTVYFKDGSTQTGNSIWIENGKVYLSDSKETYEFTADEVKMEETEESNRIGKFKNNTSMADHKQSKSSVNTKQGLIDQVIEATETRKQLDGMMESLGNDDFDTVFRKSFNPATAEKVVRKHLAKKLNKQILTEVLAWHRSTAGKRITAAETLSDPDRKQKLEAFMDQEATPEFKERLQLFSEIDSSSNASEFEIRLGNRILNKIIEAVPADFPNRENMAMEMKSNMPKLETLRRQNAAKLAYRFREISTDELHSYIRFLQSPSGRKFNAAYLDAAIEVFNKPMDELGKMFHRKLTEAVTQ